MTGSDQISKAEIAKDALQSGAQAAATTVGEVATIVTRAVGDVAATLGGFATELFEIRDSSRRALAEHAELDDAPAPTELAEPAEPTELNEPTELTDEAGTAVQDQLNASLNDADLNDPS